MTLDVTFWHLFWLKKTSKFYGNVMTFWWTSTGFLWEKGTPVKCHENVMKFQWHSMGFKILVHFDGIFMEKVHGIVMEFAVIFQKKLRWESMTAFYYEGKPFFCDLPQNDKWHVKIIKTMNVILGIFLLNTNCHVPFSTCWTL